ncbi:MAG: alpha/beta hydrolase, partial [Chromatiales bacterium]|nr:alpha/beta hydrolase [Chromatiales bacterium]
MTPRNRLLATALVALAAILSLWLITPARPSFQAPGHDAAGLERVDCWFEVPRWQDVACARLHTGETAGAGDAPVVLPVVVVRGGWLARWREPVIHLHGGPGYPSFLDAETMPYWIAFIRDLGWARDFVLYDQRGTGFATPTLHCPDSVQAGLAILAQDLSLEEELAQGAAVMRRCVDHLHAAGIDPARFTTEAGVRDLRRLMQALGHRRYVLYGVSYGTRLALQAARAVPSYVRALILDSVYPPHLDDMAETPFVYQQAFDTLLDTCRKDARCGRRHPDFDQQLQRLIERLRAHPAEVAVVDPQNGLLHRIVLNDQRLITGLFSTLYTPERIAMLPTLVAEAADGDDGALRIVAEELLDLVLDTDMAEGAYHSTECRDRAPRITREAYLAAVARHPYLAWYTAPLIEHDVCAFWPVEPAPADWRAPVALDIPTLLLAGHLDPVTPPAWARETARHLAAAQVFEFTAHSHSVLDTSDCAVLVARHFLRAPDRPADHACLRRQRSLAFLPHERA